MPYLCHNYKLSSNSRPYINVKKVRGFLTISIILLCIGGTSPYVMSAQSAQAQDPIFEILPPTRANTTTQGGAGGNITSTTTPLGVDINATITTNETTVPPPISINDTLPTDNFTAPIGLNDTLPTDNFTAPIGLNDTLPTDNFTAPGAGGGQPGAEVGAAGGFEGGGGQPGAEVGVPSDVAGGGQPTQLNETVPELAPTVQPPPLPPPPIYQILSNNTGDSTNPNVAVSGSNVYVVWEDASGGNREILLMRSHDGSNFTSAQTLSNTTGESFDPRIAVSGGNVYVVWEDATTDGSSEVKFVRSADNGATFTGAKNLSNNTGISFDPRIDVSGGNVYVVWEDTTATESSDILLARSTNNGATFGLVQNLSNSPVESFDPSVVASRNKLFVTWSDDKEGDAEIIFTDKTRNIASANVSAATTTTEAGADLGLGAGGGDLGFGGAGGAGFGITPGNETGAGAGFGITPPPDASAGAGFGITPPPDASGGAGFGITPGTGGTAGGFQPVPPS
jgi:hypothetical protein